MAKEITTPGRGQVRALLVSAGNPVLSVPNGDELEEALGGLDLMVGIDLYVNETLAHCDYVLPAATMYERDDFPLAFQTLQPTPFRQATEAVIDPGRAGPRGMGGHRRPHPPAVAPHPGTDGAGRRRERHWALFGVRLTPRLLVDAVIRLGDGGDRFGLRRGGLTFSRLTADHPHGAVLAPNLRDGVLARRRGLPRAPDAAAARRDRRRDRRAVASPVTRGLSDAADRHARAPLGELLDAQRAAADARRAGPAGAHARRRRGRGQHRRRRHGADRLAARRDRRCRSW